MSMTDDNDTFPPDRKPAAADQVQQQPDEQDEGTPEPQQGQTPEAQPGQAGTILDLKAEATGRGLISAAAAVPVKAYGAAPENFANQVTRAQYMAKALLMVPEHFHGNVGDCLAIIEIAQNAGLSAYQVAAKTYKTPNGKGIAFESQLYHAFLIGSGWIKDSALHVEYEGIGGERICTVWATLRNESAPRYYSSPAFKHLHPGYSLKTRDSGGTTTTKKLSYADGQEKILNPEFKGYMPVNGSPLWDDKPDVQMFYDTSRDWGRMFAPIATLGMQAQYESIEHPLPAPDGGNGSAGLRERIQGTQEGAEGHRSGHAEAELAQVAADRGSIAPAGEGTIKPAGKPTTAKAEPRKPAGKKQTAAEKKKAAATKATKAAADRAQATSDKNKAKQKPQPPAKPAVPTTPRSEAEYQVYCLDWINREADPEKAITRWNAERAMREGCGVRTAMKNDLRERIETKHGA